MIEMKLEEQFLTAIIITIFVCFILFIVADIDEGIHMNRRKRINCYNRFMRQHEDIIWICKAREGERCKDCICSEPCDDFQAKYNDKPCDFDALTYFMIKEGEVEDE